MGNKASKHRRPSQAKKKSRVAQEPGFASASQTATPGELSLINANTEHCMHETS